MQLGEKGCMRLPLRILEQHEDGTISTWLVGIVKTANVEEHESLLGMDCESPQPPCQVPSLLFPHSTEDSAVFTLRVGMRGRPL